MKPNPRIKTKVIQGPGGTTDLINGSGWELLINPHITEDDPRVPRVEYALKKLFGTSLMLSFFKIRNDKNESWINFSTPEDQAKKIREIGDTYSQQGVVETQPDAPMKQLHFQGFIEFYHQLNVQIDNPKLTRWLEKEMGISGVFCNFYPYPVANTTRSRYVQKSLRMARPFKFSSDFSTLDGSFVDFDTKFRR